MTIREHVRSVSILVYAQARRGAYVVCVQINAGVVEDSLNTRERVPWVNTKLDDDAVEHTGGCFFDQRQRRRGI